MFYYKQTAVCILPYIDGCESHFNSPLKVLLPPYTFKYSYRYPVCGRDK